MKIIVIQSGPAYEVLLLSGVLIGLKKKYPDAKTLWVGDPAYFPLIKFNKRIKKHLNIHKSGDLAALTSFYGSDVCYNTSLDRSAQKFASTTNSKVYYGFNERGAVDGSATFFQNVLTNQLITRKTILDLYYNLAGMTWHGEGYGLSYYPRHKQSKGTGIYCQSEIWMEGEKLTLPINLLQKFDTINQYAHIITDDLFVLHVALALRKKATFVGNLPYNLNFQGNIV